MSTGALFTVPSDKKFIFICGLHRSGTSVLFKSLRDHPDVSGFSGTGVPQDEGQHLQSVYLPAKAYGGPGRFGFNSASFLDETSPLVTPENGSRLFSDWARYWDVQKPVLLEKSPPNIVRSRFLKALFPNSVFLMIMRHPLTVAIATHKWSGTSIESLVEHWLVCHERFELDKSYLQHLYEMKYEDFVQTPQLHLDRIFDLIGIDKISLSRQIDDSHDRKYSELWEFHARTGVLDRFLSRMQCFGYDLSQRR